MSMKRKYAIGNDKVLVYVDEPLVEGYEEAKAVSQIKAVCDHPVRDDIVEGLVYRGAKIPADLVKDVFGTIRQYPNREVGFMLLYKGSEHKWKIQCPEQRGGGAAVTYKGERDEEGYSEVGTIHTHPQMGAFWSGTDHANNAGKHGLHIVFGLSDGLVTSYKCTLYTVHNQYDQNLWNVMEEVSFTEKYPPRKEWTDIIDKQSFTPPAFKVPAKPMQLPPKDYDYPQAQRSLRSMTMYEDDLHQRFQFDTERDRIKECVVEFIGQLMEDNLDLVQSAAADNGMDNVIVLPHDIEKQQEGVEEQLANILCTLTLTPDRMFLVLSTLLWNMLSDYPSDVEESMGREEYEKYRQGLKMLLNMHGLKGDVVSPIEANSKWHEVDAYQRMLSARINAEDSKC